MYKLIYMFLYIFDQPHWYIIFYKNLSKGIHELVKFRTGHQYDLIGHLHFPALI